MAMSEQELQPVVRSSSATCLAVPESFVLLLLQRLVSLAPPHFNTPPDTLAWAVIDESGKRAGSTGLADAELIVQQVTKTAQVFWLKLYPAHRTIHLGLELFPREFLEIELALDRRTIAIKTQVASQAAAAALVDIAAQGLELTPVVLPNYHAYLSNLLDRFWRDHSEYERNVFLIMRFKDEHVFVRIVDTIRTVMASHNLYLVRADDKAYTDDLWDNVMTYMYGCAYGIAIYDQINSSDFNPSVAIETGFMLAQGKRVLLLKDQSITALPVDLVGKIYRSFNTYEPQTTIPPQIHKWVMDIGITT